MEWFIVTDTTPAATTRNLLSYGPYTHADAWAHFAELGAEVAGNSVVARARDHKHAVTKCRGIF